MELKIGDLLDINFDFVLGNWTLTTKPDVITQAQLLLGKNSFDHLAISFKSALAFAVYDFDFNEIFANEALLGNSALDFQTPYELSGTFNAADFCDKNFSHVNVWARDPIDDNAVIPEPSTLILLGAGLLGLGFCTRRRRK